LDGIASSNLEVTCANHQCTQRCARQPRRTSAGEALSVSG
jgi:hypothetical protein